MNVHVSFTNNWMDEPEADEWVNKGLGFEKTPIVDGYASHEIGRAEPFKVTTLNGLSELIGKIGLSCVIFNSDDGLSLEIYNDYRE